MDPRTLLWWMIVAAIVYLLLPFDLIPDLFGLPGRLDDLGVIGLLFWLYRNHARQFIASRGQEQMNRQSTNSGAGRGASHRASHTRSFDPYEVLGIAQTATRDEVQAAYRARMQEYHPDKVAHLGEELQKLAHEKAQEIQRAYQQLKR